MRFNLKILLLLKIFIIACVGGCHQFPTPHVSITDQAIDVRGLRDDIYYLPENILYHEGDLPKTPEGQFDFTNSSVKWEKIKSVKRSKFDIKGIKGWTQLPLPKIKTDNHFILFIKRIFHFFEIYCNNELIYTYGDFNRLEERGFHVKPFHFIPLKKEYYGQTFYVRHWSNIGRMGYYTSPYITTERRFFSNLISEEFPQSIVCLTAFALAFFILLLPASRKDYLLVISLSIFMTFAGLYLLSRLDISSFFFDSDVVRVYMEWVPLYGFSFSCSFFINYFLQNRIIKYYSIFSLIFATVLFALVQFRIYGTPWSVLPYIQGLIVVGIILMVVLSTFKMLRGDKSARIIWIGFFSIFIVSAIEIAINNGFMPFGSNINFLFFGFLGFLLAIFFVARVYLKNNANELIKTSQSLIERNLTLEKTKADLELANNIAKESKRQIEISHNRIKHLLDVTRQMGLKELPEEAIQIALQQLYNEFRYHKIGFESKAKIFEWTQANNESSNNTECKKIKVFHFQINENTYNVNLIFFESRQVENTELNIKNNIIEYDEVNGLVINLNWGNKKIAEISIPQTDSFIEHDNDYMEALAASLTVALVNILSHQSHNQSLIRLVTLASDISDRLNSPLLVVINALSRIKSLEVSPEIKKIINYMESSLMAIEHLSHQLSEVRDASQIEATKTITLLKT